MSYGARTESQLVTGTTTAGNRVTGTIVGSKRGLDANIVNTAIAVNNATMTATSGGLSIFRSIDLDQTEEEVKATIGQVFFIHAMNLATAPRYLKFYNAPAAVVVVGTTTPVMTIPLPAQADSNGGGFVVSIPQGLAFSTAITVAATTGVADADAGAPAANEVVVNIGFK